MFYEKYDFIQWKNSQKVAETKNMCMKLVCCQERSKEKCMRRSSRTTTQKLMAMLQICYRNEER